MSKNIKLIKRIVLISILSSLSIILYIIGPKFPLGIFPQFLEINFSMLPVFIGLLVLGPIDGIVIVLIRFFIKLLNSNTAYVGEITDLILGLFVVCGTYLGIIISKNKSIRTKNAYILVFAVFSWIIGGVISNTFALPGYIYIAGFPKEAIVKMMPKFFHANVNNYIYKYFIFAVIPFNLIISLIVLTITLPVYNKLRLIYINDFNDKKVEKDDKLEINDENKQI